MTIYKFGLTDVIDVYKFVPTVYCLTRDDNVLIHNNYGNLL